MADLPERLRLVIFDLDGVVYRGDTAVPGSVALVRHLHEAGVRLRFATNNSMVARSGYVARLALMGIEAALDEIVTSATATVEHLARRAPDARRVLVVGASGLVDELQGAGYAVTPAAAAAPAGYSGGLLDASYDAVVVGLDLAFDYRRLAAAASAVRAGARFFATNADLRYPTEEGFLPGAGAVVAAIAAAAGGVEPEVIGKPQPTMFSGILAAAGVPAGEALVIGDNPDADMVAAHRAGIASVLVLTGVTDRATVGTLRGERQPDAVAEGPETVLELLDGRLS